jgi:hypothetical protein
MHLQDLTTMKNSSWGVAIINLLSKNLTNIKMNTGFSEVPDIQQSVNYLKGQK